MVHTPVGAGQDPGSAYTHIAAVAAPEGVEIGQGKDMAAAAADCTVAAEERVVEDRAEDLCSARGFAVAAEARPVP